MALATHVTARYGTNTKFLRGLTNQDDDDAATVNDTRLGLACDAAEADFLTYAQTAYSDTDQRHIELGVQGAIAYLKTWTTGGDADTILRPFRDALTAYAKTDSRKRFTPTYTAPTDPAVPVFDGLVPVWTEDEDPDA